MKNSFNMLCKALAIFSLLVLSSCSKSEAYSNSSSKYKITITLNDVNETNDFVSLTVVGNNQSGNVNFPLWRLNGIDQPNSLTVSLNKNNFTGNTVTYIIETVNPIEIFSAGVQIINYGPPLTGTFKIETDGNVVINETINLVGDNTDFTHNYTF